MDWYVCKHTEYPEGRKIYAKNIYSQRHWRWRSGFLDRKNPIFKIFSQKFKFRQLRMPSKATQNLYEKFWKLDFSWPSKKRPFFKLIAVKNSFWCVVFWLGKIQFLIFFYKYLYLGSFWPLLITCMAAIFFLKIGFFLVI